MSLSARIARSLSANAAGERFGAAARQPYVSSTSSSSFSSAKASASFRTGASPVSRLGRHRHVQQAAGGLHDETFLRHVRRQLFQQRQLLAERRPPDAPTVDDTRAQHLVLREAVVANRLHVAGPAMHEVQADALHRQRLQMAVMLDGFEIRLQHDVQPRRRGGEASHRPREAAAAPLVATGDRDRLVHLHPPYAFALQLLQQLHVERQQPVQPQVGLLRGIALG